jgi:hypothetical protein
VVAALATGERAGEVDRCGVAVSRLAAKLDKATKVGWVDLSTPHRAIAAASDARHVIAQVAPPLQAYVATWRASLPGSTIHATTFHLQLIAHVTLHLFLL